MGWGGSAAFMETFFGKNPKYYFKYFWSCILNALNLF